MIDFQSIFFTAFWLRKVFQAFQYNYLLLLFRLGVDLSRKYDRLCTALDTKNNLDEYIVAMFDPPHLLKLVRNALGTWKKMIDGEGNEISWQHIVDLYNYQKKNGFTLANKLTKQHVLYEKNKMKVKYAAQLISNSVANALLTMSELKYDSFVDVNGTVKYLKTFDCIFDIMNSQTTAEKYGKAPLQQRNEAKWKSIFHDSVQYICNLKTTNGKNVLESEKYASFLGKIYCNIKALKNSGPQIMGSVGMQKDLNLKRPCMQLFFYVEF